MGYTVARRFAEGGLADSSRRLVASMAAQRATSGVLDTAALVGAIAQLSGDAAAQRQVIVNMVANNPVAEPTSVTTARKLRTAAAMIGLT